MGVNTMKKINLFASLSAMIMALAFMSCQTDSDSHEHSFSEEWKYDETYHWHEATCEHKTAVGSKEEHTFGEWTVTVVATEANKGSKERVCSVCLYRQVKAIPRLDHEHDCSEEWKTDAVYHWYVCSICNELVEKEEHAFGVWKIITEPTDNTKGLKERVCSVCNYKEERNVAELSHEHKQKEEWKSNVVKHWHVCSECNNVVEKSEAAHSFGPWTVTKKPTTEDGEKERICSVCSYKETQVIPKIFLKIDGGTITGKENKTNDSGVFTKGREITLSNFYMSKYEVTKAQYKEIMEDTALNTLAITADPSYSSLQPESYVIADGEEDSERPVENVTWYDAVYFCNLLSQKEGLEPVYTIKHPETEVISDAGKSVTYIKNATVTADHTKNGYRLPTEAEWEYAARGGDPNLDEWDYPFSGSDTADEAKYTDSRNSGLDAAGWYYYNTCNGGITATEIPSSGKEGYGAHQVGQKKHNVLGLYDMSGNVWEWCYDLYDYSTAQRSEKDPTGPNSGSYRVKRGGSWNNGAYDASVCFWSCFNPSEKGNSLGFRLVRSADQRWLVL